MTQAILSWIKESNTAAAALEPTVRDTCSTIRN